MDPVQSVIEYLLGYGLPGLIAAYFANRYMQKEREMEALRDKYEARMERQQDEHEAEVDAWSARYEKLQQDRLSDWQKWHEGQQRPPVSGGD